MDRETHGMDRERVMEQVLALEGKLGGLGSAQRWLRRACDALMVVVVVVAAPLLLAPSVFAASSSGPVWNVTHSPQPTHLTAGGSGQGYRVVVSNIGGAPSVGTTTVTVQLPAGVTATGVDTLGNSSNGLWDCPGIAGASVITCNILIGNSRTYVGPDVPSYTSAFPLTIFVAVDPGARGVAESVVTVSGGGAAKSDTSRHMDVIGDDAATFGIASFSGWASAPDGSPATQAGAHPDVTTDIELNTIGNKHDSGYALPTLPAGAPVSAGNPKDISVNLPAGLVGDPTSTPRCSAALIATPNVPQCPADTQVGMVEASVATGGPELGYFFVPVFNIDPPPGVAGRLAFNLSGVVTNIDARVRTGGDYGLEANVTRISQSLAVVGSKVTLWGVPSDPSHDTWRWDPDPYVTNFRTRSAVAPRLPFMTAPTRCSGAALETTVTAKPWSDPSMVSSASFSSDMNGDPITLTGCDKLRFDPTVAAVPTSSEPDAPTGLKVQIDSPQGLDNPDGLASAHLKDVKVTLPEGMTINPASADGLGACSDAQLGLTNADEPRCPDSAKIGTVTAKTPLLNEELSGGVYIRSQASDDPESGDMFRMAVVLENKERGILVKLPGAIRVNKVTGRIVTEFVNNPQLPVEQVTLSLKSGPRAPLATPATCGTKTIDMQLTSWSGKSVDRQSTFTVDCSAGLGGFAPVFRAGTADPTGGAFSPFALSITKPDGNADLKGLSVSLPAGLLARLKGNLNTQVGTVKAFAGPGASPFMLPGQVFLEGRYGDAPFSLRVVVPAKAGPFDLGEVVVRQKIYVDPIDAHVTVVSDPVPTIVKGVPVRLQRLDVSVDKPNFIVNPTSCAAKSIGGVLKSVADQTAAVSVRFRVADCASLALKPSLALTLSGKGQTTDGKHPAVSATLTQPAGQANLKKVTVTLPLSLALDTDNANGLCEFVDGSKAEPTCPKASIVGTATATTPILDEPLSGPVYFVKNVRKDPKSGREIRTLPKLVIPLVGQNGVKLTLTGTSDVEDDQLVTTFNNIPDAPVSSFKLNIIGGKGGILAVSGADICKATQVADQQITGQSNKRADTDVYIQTPSCPLKVLSKKVGKTSVAIKVGGLSAGKVTVTGRGIKKTSKTIAKSTVATITARRTKGTPGKVTVSFDPTGPAKARKTSK